MTAIVIFYVFYLFSNTFPYPLLPVVNDLYVLLLESSFMAFFFPSGFVMKEPVQIKPIFYMPGQEMLPLPDSPKVYLRPLA